MNAIRRRLSKLQALTGIQLLRSSKWYDGYFGQWRQHFRHAENLGLHILPVHYYSPIPDTRVASAHALKADPASLQIDLDLSLVRLEQLLTAHKPPVEDWLTKRPPAEQRYSFQNNAYLAGDAEILHAMISEHRPRRIVEIGCGNSSLIISEALDALRVKDNAFKCEYTCIEPYPPSYLQPPPRSVSRFESTMLQDIPLDYFGKLEAGDVLFIDSSHVLAKGSDVAHLYLKIMPVIRPGVIIHVHDIFLPFDYPDTWLTRHYFFWNEQYLLHGMLLFGTAFKILMPTFALAKLKRDAFSKLLPSTDNATDPPSSFWMMKQ